jgi:ElaB/YqjD/DUF883 family membrane-anchored ribosome-binding protein
MTKAATHRSRISSHTNGHRNGDLKNLITEAKSALGTVGEHASENIQTLKSRLGDTLGVVRARAKRIAKSARRQAGIADDKIRAYPYQAMLVAASIGLIAGVLISRRRALAR